MSMFIIATFFAVAGLALAVALWLAYVEEQEMLAKAKGKLTTAQVTSSSAAPLAAEPIMPMTTKKALPLVQPALQITEKSLPLPSVNKQSMPAVSNGQLYELAHELHALQAQSREMNKRLDTLTVLLEQQLQMLSSHHTYMQEDLAG